MKPLSWYSSCQSQYKSRPEHNHYPASSPRYCLVSVRPYCGLVGSYTVKARLLMKGIWRLIEQKWNNDLLEAIVTQFLEWSKNLPLLTKIEVPRSYFQQAVERLELKLFGDSSQDVFVAVALLRCKLGFKGTDTTELTSLFRKARVVPMKCLRVPNVELQGALLAFRLRQ